MAKFVEVKLEGRSLFVNSDYVREVRPNAPRPGLTTLIYDTGLEIQFPGGHVEFIAQANAAD